MIQKATFILTFPKFAARSSLLLSRLTRQSVVTSETRKTRSSTPEAQSQFQEKKKVKPGSKSKSHRLCHGILPRRAARVFYH